MTRKIFKIGNSLAVTIPSQVQVKEGELLEFEKTGNKLVYKLPAGTTPQVTKNVKSTSGAVKLPKPVAQKLIDELLEEKQNEELADFLRL